MWCHPQYFDKWIDGYINAVLHNFPTRKLCNYITVYFMSSQKNQASLPNIKINKIIIFCLEL
jgi:hypothetical protein